MRGLYEGKEEGATDLVVLLKEVREGARDETTITEPLHSSSDGECLP